LVARTLITTADARTWPEDANEPVLFLGEWCKIYSRKEKWSVIDAIVEPYHWNNRKKLYEDYKYLSKFYDRILQEVVLIMNGYHNTDYSIRYWEIVIGPWLKRFIEITYDRWEMITLVLLNNNIHYTMALKIPDNEVTPDGFGGFASLHEDDLWNHWMYTKIIKFHGSVDTKMVSYLKESKNERSKVSLKLIAINALKRSAKLINLLSKKNSVFFVSSGFKLLDQFKLEISLGQIPNPVAPVVLGEMVNYYNIHDRRKININLNYEREFEEFVANILPAQIPVGYLEGFSSLVEIANRQFWPSNPKVILTSNSDVGDDIFKIWSAGKIEKGAKLIISQHGGNFGSAKWNSLERHQISIADEFISWGWDGDKVVSLPSPKLTALNINKDRNNGGGVLMVVTSVPRYSYWMYSSPVAGQFNDYISDQINFVDLLPERILEKLTIKLDCHDYGWSVKRRLCDSGFEKNIAPLHSDHNLLVSKSRIYIGTYNATTILEVLVQNIPIIIFWNPRHWEVRGSSKGDYELLCEAGILHYSPESAVEKLIAIWDDAEAWWGCSKVQRARSAFCHKYAYTSIKWRNIWGNYLRSHIKEPSNE
jgi:putative transferase (TIGR04331 family)